MLKLLVAASTVFLAVVPLSATATTLPAASTSLSFFDGSNCTCSTLPNSQAEELGPSLFLVGTATASLGGNFPMKHSGPPFVSASVASSGPAISDAFSANAFAEYWFAVTGGPVGTSVPLILSATGMADTESNPGGASSSGALDLYHLHGTQFVGSTLANLNFPGTDTSFSISKHFNAIVGDFYNVQMGVTAVLPAGDVDSAGAIIDPTVSFASLADASVFSLQFSDGVEDAIGPTPPATPLPAALPLFATGLGGLGLLGWRRKRKGTVC